jgi:hypothetical protein
MSPGFDQVAVFFEHFCCCGQALQFLRVHERVALWARQGARRERAGAVCAISN